MYKRFFKRTGDFIFSLLGLIILLPVYIVLCIVLFVTMNRKVFFTQERVGKNNHTFKVLKFKSMNDKRDTEGELLSNEERMTRIGRFIRATSLDEMPQLINVLKGDMSFIGPRPLHVRYLKYYSDEESKRHFVRPGITGLAQVSGRNNIGWDERLRLDVEYVDNLSFYNDLNIILMTIKKVFKTSEVKSEGIEGLDEYRERIMLENKSI
mgnify:CR=1 FL=1